jgi:hypothetical protein
LPIGHSAHRDWTDRSRTESKCTDRQYAHGGSARWDCMRSTLCLCHELVSLRRSSHAGLPLTQNWIGKSFVHTMRGPYLQSCRDKLGVFVCVDVEHLTPSHANNVNAVVVVG